MAKKSLSEKYRESLPAAKAVDESKYAKAKLSSSKGGLSWLEANAEQLLKTIAAVIEDGAAILLARTSDGGALVIRVVDDTGSHAWYPASEQEIHDDLAEIGKAAINP